MRTYLAVDAGTTAIKILLADETRQVLFTAEQTVTVSRPQPFCAELDMDAYWQTLCSLTAQAQKACPDAWKKLQGICVAGQGDGLWPLDSRGYTFIPAVLWQDTRAAALCNAPAALFVRHHSNRLQPGQRGAILCWLRRNRPEDYGRIAHPLGCVSFLNYRLTGVAAEDESCCGDCFDIVAGRHVAELYEYLGIADMFQKLPEVTGSGQTIGAVTSAAEGESAIPAGVPVYGGCLDATAAVMGEGRMRQGCVSVCAGTTLMVMLAQEHEPAFPLPEGVYADRLNYDKPLYRLCFAPSSGASAIARAREQYAPEISYEEVYAQIAACPMGSAGLICLPFLTGERSPFDCPGARGGYYGERPEHTAQEHLRAAAEGVLFAARHCMDCVETEIETIELSGGAARSPVFCQMAADILGLPVEVGQGVYAGVNGCLDNYVPGGRNSQYTAADTEKNEISAGQAGTGSCRAGISALSGYNRCNDAGLESAK